MIPFPKRDYSLEDNELWTKVSAVVYAMGRDEAEFTARGVTAADRTAFEAQGDAFEVFPTDTQMLALVSMAVEAKNIEKNNTAKLVQEISGYVQQKWSLKSPQYKYLGVSGYSNMKEGLQITAARSCASGAENFLAELTPIGLTQVNIDELRAAAQSYETKRNEVAEKEMERDEKTRERRIAGNALYAKLVEYCEVGKLIWENTNPSYYEDYVIYKTVHSGLAKVQNFSAQQTGPNAYDLTWDLVVDADFYEVEFAESSGGQPKGPWQTYQSPANPPVGFAVNPGFTYWLRVRAKNNQGKTGNWSDEVVI
jgi:hypothetical protein